MADLPRARELQHLEMPDQVRPRIGKRRLDRIADPGLCCKMDNLVEFLGSKQCFHAGTVANVQLHKTEIGVTGESGQPAFLQADFVIVVHVVEADDLVAPCQEAN